MIPNYVIGSCTMPACLRLAGGAAGGGSSHWHINNIPYPSCAAALCQLDNSLSGQRRGERAQTSCYYHHCLLGYTPMDAEWHANEQKTPVS